MWSGWGASTPEESRFDTLANVRAEAWGIEISEREGAVVISAASRPGSALTSTSHGQTGLGEDESGPSLQTPSPPPPSLVGTTHSKTRRTLPEPHRLEGTPELLKDISVASTPGSRLRLSESPQRGVPLAPKGRSLTPTQLGSIPPQVASTPHDSSPDAARRIFPSTTESLAPPASPAGAIGLRLSSQSRPASASMHGSRRASQKTMQEEEVEGVAAGEEEVLEEMEKVAELIRAAANGDTDFREAEYLQLRVKQLESQLEATEHAPRPRLPHLSSTQPSSGGVDSAGARIYTVELKYQATDAQNRRKFTGQLVNGKRHGSGVMLWWDNHKYEGEWANDQPCGAAVESYPDGSIYEGQILKDLRHGLGSYVAAGGTTIAGHWEQGKLHGAALLTRPPKDAPATQPPGDGAQPQNRPPEFALVTYDRGSLVSTLQNPQSVEKVALLLAELTSVREAASEAAANARDLAAGLAAASAARPATPLRCASTGGGWLADKAASARLRARLSSSEGHVGASTRSRSLAGPGVVPPSTPSASGLSVASVGRPGSARPGSATRAGSAGRKGFALPSPAPVSGFPERLGGPVARLEKQGSILEEPPAS